MVVVGHSLGAGTAAILAIMMKQEFPSLHCYAYSPPGGLLRSVVMQLLSWLINDLLAKLFNNPTHWTVIIKLTYVWHCTDPHYEWYITSNVLVSAIIIAWLLMQLLSKACILTSVWILLLVILSLDYGYHDYDHA